MSPLLRARGRAAREGWPVALSPRFPYAHICEALSAWGVRRRLRCVSVVRACSTGELLDKEERMAKARINIALDPDIIRELDQRVLDGEYRSRSEAIEDYLDEGLFDYGDSDSDGDSECDDEDSDD